MKMTIDGREIEFRAGQTIYEAAKAAGISIPVLCHHELVKPVGACRVCVVEVVGARSLVASCAMPAENGMVVSTGNERVLKARKLIVELLMTQGRHNCITCESSGDCVLQDLAYKLGVETPRFDEPAAALEKETGNAMIVRDMNKCVLCGLCVRVCNELQVNQVLDYTGRGPSAKVGPPFGQRYEDSNCVFCGECVRVCPVGALYEKQGRFLGREKDLAAVRTTCAYCGVGCQLDLRVKDGRMVKITTAREGAPVPNRGSLCIKGRFGHDFVHHPERLTMPLIRKEGELREATWEEAIGYVADKLTAIKQAHGADAIAGLSSARCTNEENYLFQKFMRAVLGTNNVDHCARLCHASTVAGLATSFGSGAMTNSIADLGQSDCFLITGSNTTETHPVIGTIVKRAVTQRGAKLILADPRNIELAKFATVHLHQKPGTDVAWINGMLNVIIAEGLLNRAFIDERTENFEAVKEAVEKYTPAYVESISGIPKDDLVTAARLYAQAGAAAIIYAMGITQHTTGTDAVKSLANLAMATGNIGRPGTGVNPLRGQNNVQGACDMGCLPGNFTAYLQVANAEHRKKFEDAWGVSLNPKPGLTVPRIIEGADKGAIKALIIMGENPMMSDPDLTHVEHALGKLDLLVVQDIFLSETARLAHVVLPTSAWGEKDGTYTSTERRVQRIRKAVDAPGHARHDWEVLGLLAARLGTNWHYTCAKDIMEEINSVTASYKGITYERIEETGLHWPCPTPEHPGTPILHTAGFTRGKGLFCVTEYLPAAEQPDQDYPFILTTGRILYQYHTATMSRRSQGLVSRTPAAFVEINPLDASRLGIENGADVEVSSRRGSIRLSAEVTERVEPGVLFIPFHYSEAAVNKLTIAAIDPIANIPEFKVCAANIRA